jgi:DNA-directed RNA polymerase subunit N (RpoN/RPB10)
MKLDWELSIVDMFITTYCCRLYLTDKVICDDTLDKFHSFVYNEFSQIDEMLAYTFQEESKRKYEEYFEAIRSDGSFKSICKELGENIYEKEVYDAFTLYALKIYIEANFRLVTDVIKGILKDRDLRLAEQ